MSAPVNNNLPVNNDSSLYNLNVQTPNTLNPTTSPTTATSSTSNTTNDPTTSTSLPVGGKKGGAGASSLQYIDPNAITTTQEILIEEQYEQTVAQQIQAQQLQQQQLSDSTNSSNGQAARRNLSNVNFRI
jgi:hypothetical protein